MRLDREYRPDIGTQIQSFEQSRVIIHDYTGYGNVPTLFNKSDIMVYHPKIGTSYSQANYFHWDASHRFLDIEFLDNTRIWEPGYYSGYTNDLYFMPYDPNKKRSIDERAALIAKFPPSYPYEHWLWNTIGEIPKGRYRVFCPQGERIVVRWYFEKLPQDLISIKREEKEYTLVPTQTVLNEILTEDKDFITASSYESGSYQKWYPWSRESTSGWSPNPTNDKERWLQYDFRTPKRANVVYITNGDRYSDGRTPAGFDIYGSNDEKNFDLLMSRRSEHYWHTHETRKFYMKNTKAYRYYRFRLVDVNGTVTDYYTEIAGIIYAYESNELIEIDSSDDVGKSKFLTSEILNLEEPVNRESFVIKPDEVSNKVVRKLTKEPLSIGFS